MNDTKEITILLIDDHNMIIEGYKNVLLNIDGIHFEIDTANSCDRAWGKIKNKKYDLIFLDINFKHAETNKILSGEDLGIMIKKAYPENKIIIITVLEDSFRLHNILTNINPDGFLLKGETNVKELKRCVETVLSSPPYYGSKIAKLLQSNVTYEFALDKIDRLILHQLSLGTKTKDIPQYINLSLRAVENRKRRLKNIFGVSGKGNKALLEKARESGYV